MKLPIQTYFSAFSVHQTQSPFAAFSDKGTSETLPMMMWQNECGYGPTPGCMMKSEEMNGVPSGHVDRTHGKRKKAQSLSQFSLNQYSQFSLNQYFPIFSVGMEGAHTEYTCFDCNVIQIDQTSPEIMWAIIFFFFQF